MDIESQKSPYWKIIKVYRAAKKLKRFNLTDIDKELGLARGSHISSRKSINILVYLNILEIDSSKKRTYYNFIQNARN